MADPSKFPSTNFQGSSSQSILIEVKEREGVNVGIQPGVAFPECYRRDSKGEKYDSRADQRHLMFKQVTFERTVWYFCIAKLRCFFNKSFSLLILYSVRLVQQEDNENINVGNLYKNKEN